MSQELINEEHEEDFRPLTPEQAAKWRSQFPQENVWLLMKAQCLVGLSVVSLSFLAEYGTGGFGWGLSSLYGVMVVILPAFVCARGLNSKFGVGVAASLVKFFVWEFAKIALSVAMLILAPRILVDELSWPALLVGLVFTFKGFWAYVVWRQAVHSKSAKIR